MLVSSQQREADRLVSSLLNDTAANLGPTLIGLGEQRERVEGRLREVLDSESTASNLRRARLGLCHFDSSYVCKVVNDVIRPDSSIHEIILVADLIDQSSEVEKKDVFDSLSQQAVSLRSLTLLVKSGLSLEKIDIQGSAELLAPLSKVPSESLDAWLEVLMPVSKQFKDELEHLLRTNSNNVEKVAACPIYSEAIYRYHTVEDRQAIFKRILMEPKNSVEFECVCRCLDDNCEEASVWEQLNSWVDKDELNEEQFANLSIALARLRKPQRLIECFDNQHQSMARSYAIVNSSKFLKVGRLEEIYDESSNVSHLVRQGLLLSIAEQIPDMEPNQRKPWVTKARNLHLNDLHASCFAAAELVLRRCNVFDMHALRKKRCKEFGCRHGDVYINDVGIAFAVVEPDELNLLSKPIGVSITEITNAEFFGAGSPNSNLPVVLHDLREIELFCSSLNLIEGIESKPLIFVDNDLERLTIQQEAAGYRVMINDEWDAIGSLIGLDFLGANLELSHKFATLLSSINSLHGEVAEVGIRLPN